MALKHTLPLLLPCLIGLMVGLSSSTNSQNQQPRASPKRPWHDRPDLVSVQTTSGLLEGAKEPIRLGNGSISVYKFLAIPYARAPIGELRFKRPQELASEQSSQRIDASRHASTCPQFRHLARFISPLLKLDAEHQTSEDCLHLNVYAPASVGKLAEGSGNRLEPSKQLPVLVWIPGEGFDFADARQFDGSYLAHQTQSIVITVQYRVGVLGFLDAPELGVKGNMGLHDQVMALRWVRANAAAFGGDAQRVTVMGRFSGSMSISALLTAPKSQLLVADDGQALFKRAALLSGVAVEDWIIEESQTNKWERMVESARASSSACDESQLRTNLSCWQDLSADQLLAVSGHGWKLVVDNELVAAGGPMAALKSRPMLPGVEALLLGETATEGTLCLYRHQLQAKQNDYAQLIDSDKLTSERLNEIIQDDSLTYFKYNITESNPMRMALEAIVEQERRSELGAGEQEQGQGAGSARLRDHYLKACSSYMVHAHNNRLKRHLETRNREAEGSLKQRPVELFHYQLKYRPSFSLAPAYVRTAAHGDDIPLIFGLVYGQQRANVPEGDLMITRKMMSYVGNFVHGNHPLLQQHAPVNSNSNDEDAAAANEGEADEGSPQHRVGWAAGVQVHAMDLGDCEHERARFNANSNSNTIPNTNNNNLKRPLHHGDLLNSEHWQLETTMDPATGAGVGRLIQRPASAAAQSAANLKMLLMESPQMLELKVDSFEQQPQQPVTRSQRLIELHRQQLDSDAASVPAATNYWLLKPRKNHHALMAVPQISADILQSSVSLTSHQAAARANEQQQMVESGLSQPGGGSSTNPLTSDSYLMGALLIGACVAIFALTSFCIVLSLIVFRYHLARQSRGMVECKKRFDSSSSTCNICDESQGSSIDAVLNAAGQPHHHAGEHASAPAGPKKVNHSFCNVFAKLRHQSCPPEEQHAGRPLCQSDHLQRHTQASNNNNSGPCKNHHLQVQFAEQRKALASEDSRSAT